MCAKQGRRPENRARNRTRKALLLLALFCGPLCGLLCPVSVVLFSGAVLLSLSSVLRGSLGGFYCAGLFFPLFHGRRPRNRALWKATPKYVRGDGVRGYLHLWKRWAAYCIVHSTIPLSFLAFVHYRFRVLDFPWPSRERKRYYSLWSSVFPVPSAPRGITSCSRLSPNARRHNSSRQPRHIVYLAMAVAAAVRDRRCGVFRRSDSLGLSSS